MSRTDTHWWQSGVIYHCYPRSFMDGDGDGIGDLPGLRTRLDHLEWLGVDALWLSPIYPSPMADFGYDVSNYTDIHPLFGTLADFDALVRDAHARGIRVILDFIPNHTSDEHPWFQASRASPRSDKRDWYIWRDPGPDGGPPNNWLASFGGAAWSWDETAGQYYYHAYLARQPDLNLRNPAVRKALGDVLRFWLDRGVDGFRIDALRQIVKDDHWRDNPPNPDWSPDEGPYKSLLPVYTTDRPEVKEIIAQWRQLSDRYDERVLIGELYLPIERLVTYYGRDGEGIHLPFNFHLISERWEARAIEALIERYEAALPADAWPNWVLGNHDNHRVASRIGAAQARVAAMLLLTLRGTPTLYYGDELGMKDVPIPPDRVQDPFEKNVAGLGLGRDPERTPMQWDGGANAGFTTGTPWLPVADDHAVTNVAAERRDPRSMLNLHRRLLALRRSSQALCVGDYRHVPADGTLLAYRRLHGDQQFLVALNLGAQPQTLDLSSLAGHREVALSTHLDREGERPAGSLALRPDEGVVVSLQDALR